MNKRGKNTGSWQKRNCEKKWFATIFGNQKEEEFLNGSFLLLTYFVAHIQYTNHRYHVLHQDTEYLYLPLDLSEVFMSWAVPELYIIRLWLLYIAVLSAIFLFLFSCMSLFRFLDQIFVFLLTLKYFFFLGGWLGGRRGI